MSANRRNLDDTFFALAAPTRRKLLSLLAQGESRVTELALPFDIALNSVSKHIQVLERAHLVQRRLVGREHFISLKTQPLDRALAWMTEQRHAWNTQLQALDSMLRAEDALAGIRQKQRSAAGT